MTIRKISPELQKIAIREINEDPKRITEDLEHIRLWLQKQPHIKARTDDQWLISFLRGSKYSLEKCKEKLDFYYSTRNLTPEFYGLRDPLSPIIQECLSKGYIVPLLEPTQDGRRAVIVRCSLFEPGKIEVEETFRIYGVFSDIMQMEDDLFVICGYHCIIDMQFLTFNKMVTITPAFLKKLAFILLKAMPARLRGMQFINMPTYFEGLFKLLVSFFPDKIKGRIKVVSKEEYNKIFEIFPKKILPPEYGGEGQSLDDLISYWKQRIEDYRGWFLEDVNYKTDESKRSGKPKTSEDVFGIDGSFRKLTVD